MLAGIAGVLLASFLGVSTNNAGQLTASAFSIVVLGGLGSVSGSLIAAYVVGYLGDRDGLSDRAHSATDPGPDFARARRFTPVRRDCWGGDRNADARVVQVPHFLDFGGVGRCRRVVAGSGFLAYLLGVLTSAYYFGVFAMSWDLLFGFAGEVNFGPTFLIGLGAYSAAILNNEFHAPILLCLVASAATALVGGVLLAVPALRLRGPYFGLVTLVAVLLLQNAIVIFATSPAARSA